MAFTNNNNEKKRGFFERLTGSVKFEEPEENSRTIHPVAKAGDKKATWMEEESDEAELAIDVYQTPTEIIVQTMVAGVKPEDIEITIARDMLTIRGKREESRIVDETNY